MAADVQTGMDKQEMKRLLMRSKKEPVNCAFAQGSDASVALLLLDKTKQPKGVEKDLSKQFPDAKNSRFGVAVVDTEADPKRVVFYINKPVGSMAKKLVKTLKGTGFSKVRLLLDDGTAVEDFTEDEEGAPPPGPAATARPEAPEPPLATPAPQVTTPSPAAAAEPLPASPVSGADPAALTRTLTELARRLAQADPARQGQLKGLAVTAQARLKANDPDGAAAAIAELGAALDGAGAPAPAEGATPAADPAAAAAYVKARTAWLATRQKVEADIGTLQAKFAAAFQGHSLAADLQTAFRTRVEKVLGQLDEELAEKLEAAAKATDPAQHAKLVGEAKQAVQRYQAFLASEPTLAELDDNPFVPLSIQKTLSGTLSVLSRAIV